MSRLARMTPLLLVSSLWSVSAPAPASAQDAAGESPAHISLVDGAALLERDGRAESAPASMPLLAGDRVRTAGRPRRNPLRRRQHAAPRHDSPPSTSSPTSSFASSTAACGSTSSPGGANRRVAYRIDAPSASVQITQARRIPDLGPRRRRRPRAEVELAVLRGAADLVNEDGRTTLARRRAGVCARRRWHRRRVRLQLGDVGRVRSLVGRRGAMCGSASRRSTCPTTVQAYASTFDRLRLLADTSRPTATSGIPRVAPGGGPTTTAAGRRSGRTAGRGLASDPGPGRRITTAAGASRPARGSGSPDALGAGLGVLGLRAGLRELVPARLEQPRRLWLLVRRRVSARLRPVARVDGGAASATSAAATST